MRTFGEIIIDRDVRCPRGKPPSQCRFFSTAKLTWPAEGT